MSKLRNELDKLSGRIVGSNVLQSPLGFWGRYDVWREAVKGLEKAIREMEEVKSLDDSLYAYDPAYMEALEIVITALKEIQQYRKIGTVEECRTAVEKQKPKKPVKDKYHHNCCPNCGWIVSGEGGYGEEFCPHCENCGQAIQWEESEEE